MTGMADDDRQIHLSPYPEWFATQDPVRGVWLCDKASERKLKVEPPTDWGRHWSWNVTEDGTGIYFQRKPLPPETKVISRVDGESATVLNQVGPGTYEVMTDQGIEVWQDGDIQVVED
jgi:hypothetical protein